EGAEDLAPACGRVEDRLHLGGLLAVGVEAAVLALDSGAALARGDEADIDLGVEVGVMAPVCADLPVEHQPFGRLVGDHPPPLALAAVDAALEPAPAGPRLEHRRLGVDAADRLAGEGPPRAHLLGEDLEGPLGGRL